VLSRARHQPLAEAALELWDGEDLFLGGFDIVGNAAVTDRFPVEKNIAGILDLVAWLADGADVDQRFLVLGQRVRHIFKLGRLDPFEIVCGHARTVRMADEAEPFEAIENFDGFLRWPKADVLKVLF